MQLPPLSFTVLDTETTGLTPRVHRVIEFASVRVEGGIKVDEYEELFSTDDTLPPLIQTLTRIYPKDLEGRKRVEERRAHILERIGDDTIIVGQNVMFDINMLKGEGIDLSDRPWIDTSMIASLVFPELKSYSLGYVSSALHLNHEPVHRALGDVHATLELLSRCWERLLEVPEELRCILKQTTKDSAPGYQKFFGAIPQATAVDVPEWITKGVGKYSGKRHKTQDARHKQVTNVEIETPANGTVQLLEEPLDSSYLGDLMSSVLRLSSSTVIAVKNLEHVLRHGDIPDNITVLYPPSMLTDPHAVERLAAQQQYTADEATLAVKLAWYQPETKWELPLHGNEKSIWIAKAGCNEASQTYIDQFSTDASTILIDHQHLLWILSGDDHPGNKLITPDTHVIFTNASMLEDTASKAFGANLSIDTLQAASEGNKEHTSFVNLLQIWLEKIRENQDTYYLTAKDLDSPDAWALRKRCRELLQQDIPGGIAWSLKQLQVVLAADPAVSIIVMETQGNSQKQYLNCAPKQTAQALKDTVFDLYPVTLCIPPGSQKSLQSIVPASFPTEVTDSTESALVPSVTFPEKALHDILEHPPEGKTAVLVGSRRIIDDMYVKYTEQLEEKGVTLICQGTSGGQGRMQAEFLESKGPTVWLLTPWMFEGVLLEPESIDHLFVHTLPFDHPNHSITSKRAEQFQSPFFDYSLPRLEHRLFRLIRTFRRYATEESDIHILDERIRTKKYGARIQTFIEGFSKQSENDAEQVPDGPKSSKQIDSPERDSSRVSKDNDQMSMF